MAKRYGAMRAPSVPNMGTISTKPRTVLTKRSKRKERVVSIDSQHCRGPAVETVLAWGGDGGYPSDGVAQYLFD